MTKYAYVKSVIFSDRIKVTFFTKMVLFTYMYLKISFWRYLCYLCSTPISGVCVVSYWFMVVVLACILLIYGVCVVSYWFMVFVLYLT